MLFSSRIFLSMNLAIVTSPTSSISSRWELLPIVDFQCRNANGRAEKPCFDDHPACESPCQGLVRRATLFSRERKSAAGKGLRRLPLRAARTSLGRVELQKLAAQRAAQGQRAASSPSKRSVRHLALPPALMNSSSSVLWGE